MRYDAIIAYGDIRGVRKPRIKGETRCRKNNRKVHTMPSFKVKHMLAYNRDLNASINIGNRLSGYMLDGRGSGGPPLTSPVSIIQKGNFLVVQQVREEAPSLVAE